MHHCGKSRDSKAWQNRRPDKGDIERKTGSQTATETSRWCKNKDERNAGNDHVKNEMCVGKVETQSKHKAELDDSSVPLEKIKGLHPM